MVQLSWSCYEAKVQGGPVCYPAGSGQQKMRKAGQPEARISVNPGRLRCPTTDETERNRTVIDFTDTNTTPAQQLKLTLLALNKAVSHTLPGMNMWVDLAIDDNTTPTQEDAAEAWRAAMLDTAIDTVLNSDTAIDLEPLVAELKANGCWDDMPVGWNKPEVALAPSG